MNNLSQLFLLADHIKLSLLERQRAASLQLEPNSQDGEISRSLQSLRDGLEAVERDILNAEQSNDPSALELKDQAANLRRQYEDLSSQFESESRTNPKNLPESLSDPSLEENVPRASNATTTLKHPTPQHPVPKSVRFTDDLVDNDGDPNRNALLPYRDSPSPTYDHNDISNEEIHSQHAQILREQDDQLDRLGESIGRQHQLSIQIGDELEGQIGLLDELDGHVERHTGRLGRARNRLGRIRRKAKGSSGMMTIIGLIIVLVILIVVLK
ncbi:hypothetical protein VTO42DRAFT_6080 [Malbranchea cinnamomea]